MLKQTEKQLQKAILDYLQLLENKGELWFERLNAGTAFLPAGRGMYKIKLCRLGTADVIIVKNGLILFAELKSKSGKQSIDQKSFEIKVRKVGAGYCIVRSIEELEKQLNLLNK